MLASAKLSKEEEEERASWMGSSKRGGGEVLVAPTLREKPKLKGFAN